MHSCVRLTSYVLGASCFSLSRVLSGRGVRYLLVGGPIQCTQVLGGGRPPLLLILAGGRP